MNYRISRKADIDIERICDSIADDNPDAADRLDEKIHRAIVRLAELIVRLAEFPRMGHVRADVEDTRYRFWVVGRYVIAFRVEGDELLVVRVLYGARDSRRFFRGNV